MEHVHYKHPLKPTAFGSDSPHIYANVSVVLMALPISGDFYSKISGVFFEHVL